MSCRNVAADKIVAGIKNFTCVIRLFVRFCLFDNEEFSVIYAEFLPWLECEGNGFFDLVQIFEFSSFPFGVDVFINSQFSESETESFVLNPRSTGFGRMEVTIILFLTHLLLFS